MWENQIEQMKKIGIIPVIKISDAEKAVPLAKALIDGGLPAAEVTFRTSAAAEAIGRIKKAYPNMLVGAGTVLSIEQAELAVKSGAEFIVSPGFNPKVVSWCIENNVPVVPGTSTPSEIEQALEMGLTAVKFFPAEQSGGIAKIKAMAAPYSAVSFMPTGGIGLDNMNDYLSFPKIIACGGSFMVKESLIENNNFAEITELCRKAVQKMLGFSLAHVGLYETDAKSAENTAKLFASLLSEPLDVREKSTFAGSVIEVMNEKKEGVLGHIAIGTNSVLRAKYHLESQGVAFDEQSAAFNEKGALQSVYLKDSIGGFLVHLVQK